MPKDPGSPRGVLALVAVGMVVGFGLPAVLVGVAIAIGAGALVVGCLFILGIAIELGMWGWWRHGTEPRHDMPAAPRHRLDGSDPDRAD